MNEMLLKDKVGQAEAPAIPYEDLRGWLKLAEELGEVRVVKGASWEKEIGEASEVVLHDENAPCVVFDDVPGCPKGFRVLVNFFAGKRKNMTLGFPTELTKLELTEAFRAQRMAVNNPIPPVEVDDGPILENVLEGDDIDVLKFPTPQWHTADGGRYIGTGSYDITRDPDEGWLNLGTYRVMVHNEKQVGIYISPGKHGRIHRDKYIARNEPMPVCVVVGGDPLTFLMGCTELPYGVSEFDYMGGLRGKPMEVIRGKHTGLPFPANAEIVLEGFIDPKTRLDEGPFGEWTGYYASDVRAEPVLDIKAIYHRNDPIILGCPPQRPPDELARYRAVTRSAILRENIAKAGVPDVTAVWAHEVGTARMLLGVAIKQRYPGHATQAGHVASMCHVGAYAGKYVIVVDDDIDVSDLDSLIWAMITRSAPATSIDIIHNAWSTPLDPRLTPWDREKGNFTNSRAIIDACRPFHWRDQFPLVNIPSKELSAETREKFSWVLDDPTRK
ncbi:MAG TPA: UbiD family decarboxylase, partial [Hyphomicrobiales bacterium]|nr:UbiD family decarboxylase [Hyphomicrobiales bacterium]